MKLITVNFGGNIHESVVRINDMDLADYVIAVDSSGINTVYVLKVPDELVKSIWIRLDYIAECCPIK